MEMTELTTSQYYGYDIEKLKEEEYNLETMKAHAQTCRKVIKKETTFINTITRKKGEIEITKKIRKKRNLQNSS